MHVSKPRLSKFQLWLLNNFDTFIDFCTVKKTWSTKKVSLQFCYKFIQVTACKKKTDILDLSLIKLLQPTRVQFFMSHSV